MNDRKHTLFTQDPIKLMGSPTAAKTQKHSDGITTQLEYSTARITTTNYSVNSLEDREETHVKRSPVARHSDKRTHADRSGPKSPAWLKVHLKIHTRICRNALEKQPGTKNQRAEILFSISVCCFCPMEKSCCFSNLVSEREEPSCCYVKNKQKMVSGCTFSEDRMIWFIKTPTCVKQDLYGSPPLPASAAGAFPPWSVSNFSL